MKLQGHDNKVEQVGGTILAEHEMSIRQEDQHVILGIVSHKMYSNAIRTIIQEVGSNARDAHREHGCTERPIRIKLPDRNDNSFFIQDFGVGIDPDRMANVFVNYGASTKRDSNDETGGFGLGAKSPFAYTDQFVVVTVTPDANGTLMFRQYMAITEGKRRVIKGIEERPAKVDEERGTKIVVPVKPEDFSNFRKWTIDRFRYWNVKPEVISRDNPVEWPDDVVDFEGEDGTWQMLKAPVDRWGNTNYNDRKPKAVVDGIPYPISKDSVERAGNTHDAEINNLWSFPILLHFNTGEVSMTATREELDYTVDMTAKAIRSKFEEIIKELKTKLTDRIAKADSFIEANRQWNEIKYTYTYNSIVSSVKWNGHEITGSGFNATSVCKIVHFQPDATKNTGIKRSTVNAISFNEDMRVVLDMTDSEGIATSKIAGLFESDSTIKHCYVVKLKKPEEIGSRHELYKKYKDWDKTGTLKRIHKWIKDEHNFDLYKSVMIETLPKRKPRRRPAGQKRDNAKAIRKFFYGSWRQPSWEKTELDYANDSGFIVFLKSREAYLNDDFTGYAGSHLLKELCQILDITLHGVLSAHAKKIGKGWTPILEHAKAEYNKLKKELDSMEVPDSFEVYSTSKVSNCVSSFKSKLPQNSALAKIIAKWSKSDKEIQKYREKADKFNSLVAVLKKLDNANSKKYVEIDFNCKKKSVNYAKMVEERYPFLSNFDSYYVKCSAKQCIEYIEAMDAHHGPVSV